MDILGLNTSWLTGSTPLTVGMNKTNWQTDGMTACLSMPYSMSLSFWKWQAETPKGLQHNIPLNRIMSVLFSCSETTNYLQQLWVTLDTRHRASTTKPLLCWVHYSDSKIRCGTELNWKFVQCTSIHTHGWMMVWLRHKLYNWKLVVIYSPARELGLFTRVLQSNLYAWHHTCKKLSQ